MPLLLTLNIIYLMKIFKHSKNTRILGHENLFFHDPILHVHFLLQMTKPDKVYPNSLELLTSRRFYAKMYVIVQHNVNYVASRNGMKI